MLITNQNVTNISPIKNTHFNGIHSAIKPLQSSVANSHSVSTILDSNITNFLNSNHLNVIKSFSLKKILTEALPEIIQPKNIINAGNESKVYRISDNYVLKLKHKNSRGKIITPLDVPYAPNRQFSELKCYYGEPVLKVGKAEILKNASPNNKVMECGIKFNSDELISVEEIEKYNKEYLPLCASLPQESFDELAHCLKQMNGIKKWGYLNNFDKKQNCFPKFFSVAPDVINPNNILISDGKFKIVDKLEKTLVDNPNTFYTMIEPLILRYTPYKYAEPNMLHNERRLEIFKKCLIASEKAGLSLDKTSLNNPNIDKDIRKLISDGDGVYMDYTLSLLKDMRNRKEPLELRLEVLKDLFNQM